MKHALLLLLSISFFCCITYAQGSKKSKTKAFGKTPTSASGVQTGEMTQVPPKYAKIHCFVKNNSSQSNYFSISYDNTSWQEINLNGGGTYDVAVTDSVYLKTFTNAKTYSQIVAYPTHYYQLVFSVTLKKWIFQE